jgi:hypothetical protein
MARKQNNAASAARIEAEIRRVVAKLAHRPVAEIVAVLRERGIAADPGFIASLTERK